MCLFSYQILLAQKYYLLNRFTKATRTGSLAQLVKEVKQRPSIHLKVHMNVNKVLYTISMIRRIRYSDVTNHEQCDAFECGYHYFCNFVLTIFPKSYYREE